MYNQIFETPPQGSSASDAWTWSENYSPGQATYSLLTFVNITSPYVAQVWGAYSHELILKQFFNKPELSIQISFDPYSMDRTNDPNDILAMFRGIF